MNPLLMVQNTQEVILENNYYKDVELTSIFNRSISNQI